MQLSCFCSEGIDFDHRQGQFAVVKNSFLLCQMAILQFLAVQYCSVVSVQVLVVTFRRDIFGFAPVDVGYFLNPLLFAPEYSTRTHSKKQTELDKL